MLICKADLFTKCPRNGSAYIFWWKHDRTRNPCHRHDTEDHCVNKMEQKSDGSLKMMNSWDCFCGRGWPGMPSRVDRWCGQPGGGWRSWVCRASSSPRMILFSGVLSKPYVADSQRYADRMLFKRQNIEAHGQKCLEGLSILAGLGRSITSQQCTGGSEERKEFRDQRVWCVLKKMV